MSCPFCAPKPKLRELSESNFLKIVFCMLSISFVLGAVFMPDNGISMLDGLWKIVSSPSKLTSNYFATGGASATLLNMGLVGLSCLILMFAFDCTANSGTTLAFILTVGFGSWGINVLNIWPSILGVIVYGLVKKEKLDGLVNAMMFSTGIAPIITDIMIRYPHAEVVGFNVTGVLLALFVGFLIGFFLPAGLAHSPKVHKGFDLYSAALPIGLFAFLLNAALYKTMGIDLPAGASSADLQVTAPVHVNVFCCLVFAVCVIVALVMGCKPKDYIALLKSPDHVSSVSGQFGNAVFLMNMGVFGLFIVAYYNLIGATWNGVTLGVVFCMLATCNSGSHPGNVWPIMVGYVLASLGFGWLSQLAGGSFSLPINAQAIVVGLCYANGLSPITSKYGWFWGMVAGMLHYLLVTSVPNLHGGFCLYNGGFTAAIIATVMVPELERFCKTKAERKAVKSN